VATLGYCILASFSDFYLTHRGLVDLADEHPENKLLHGRGQPGTHDVPLLVDTLRAISHMNDSDNEPSTTTTTSSRTVNLPVFDKSLFNGQGDRAPLSIQIKGPLDVFILEGWSLGFRPLPTATLESYHSQPSPVPPPSRLPPYKMHDHLLSAILQINTNLQTISEEVYPFFPLHVVIRPRSYDYVYAWRLEQERQMKALNGGRGMEDEDVRRFVDRYMPAYEVWGNEALRAGLEAEEGEEAGGRQVLELVFDEERRVVQS
jgi:D-glycerate 3-kinase